MHMMNRLTLSLWHPYEHWKMCRRGARLMFSRCISKRTRNAVVEGPYRTRCWRWEGDQRSWWVKSIRRHFSWGLRREENTAIRHMSSRRWQRICLTEIKAAPIVSSSCGLHVLTILNQSQEDQKRTMSRTRRRSSRQPKLSKLSNSWSFLVAKQQYLTPIRDKRACLLSVRDTLPIPSRNMRLPKKYSPTRWKRTSTPISSRLASSNTCKKSPACSTADLRRTLLGSSLFSIISHFITLSCKSRWMCWTKMKDSKRERLIHFQDNRWTPAILSRIVNLQKWSGRTSVWSIGSMCHFTALKQRRGWRWSKTSFRQQAT